MEENLLKTCLYDKHVALNALMSPFGGFIMPIQYTNITDEHNAVRHHAGMFDVSHMGEIFVSGPDAEKFVNHIFSNNIAGIPDVSVRYVRTYGVEQKEGFASVLLPIGRIYEFDAVGAQSAPFDRGGGGSPSEVLSASRSER